MKEKKGSSIPAIVILILAILAKASAVEKWFLRGNGESNRFFAVTKTDLALEPGEVTVLTGRTCFRSRPDPGGSCRNADTGGIL